MVESAGLAVIYKQSILVVHPTGSGWINSFSIPKGHVDEGETLLDCAIRETFEETGILIPRTQILKKPLSVTYPRTDGKMKRVYYFYARVADLKEIGLEGCDVPRDQLEINEVDWSSFLNYKVARELLANKYLPILDVFDKRNREN